MKKSIISAVLALVILFGVGGNIAVNTANAQGVTLQQIISLFIALGIIPADKVAIAEAAVGLTTTNTTNTVTPTNTITNNTATNSGQPAISIIGTPTIISSQGPMVNGNSTTTITATFDFSIQAVGGNFSLENPSAEPFTFFIYRNGVETLMSSYSHTESFSIPSSGVVTSGLPSNTAFEIQKNNSITLPVTLSFVPIGSSATYSVAIGGMRLIFNDQSQIPSIVMNVKGTPTTSNVSANGVSGTIPTPPVSSYQAMYPASVSVTYPTSGSTFTAGGSFGVGFTSANTSGSYDVKIEDALLHQSYDFGVMSSTNSGSQHQLTLPANLMTSNMFQVQIYYNGILVGVSNDFTINSSQTSTAITSSGVNTYHGTNYTAGATCTQQLTGLLISAGIISQNMAVAATQSAISNQSLPFSELVSAYVSLGYISPNMVSQANTLVTNATAGGQYQACLSSFTPSTPGITSLSPSSGPAGTAVTISGINLGTNNTVIMNSFNPINTSSNGSIVQFTVPQNASAGSYYVSVTNNANNRTSNVLTFTVTGSQTTTQMYPNLQNLNNTTQTSAQSANSQMYSAPGTNAVCGSSQGVSSATQPATNLCSVGSAYDQRVGPNSVNWLWDCVIGSDPNSVSNTIGCWAPISQ